MEQLRRVAVEKKVSELAALTRESVLMDFESTLEFLRVQKIVNKLRSSGAIREYRDEVAKWLPTAPLAGARKSKLRRHLDLCLAMQQIFEVLDNEGSKLAIWSKPRRKIIEGIFSEVERYRFEMEKAESFAIPAKGVLEGLRQTEMQRRHLRHWCDYASLLLNQMPKHEGADSAVAVVRNSVVKEAFELAQTTDSVMDVFNTYTYKNFPISVRDHTIRLSPCINEMEQALTWCTLRGRSYEIDQYESLFAGMKRLEGFIASLEAAPPDFEQFMLSNAGQTLWQKSKFVADQVRRMSSAEVQTLIDLDAPLKTRHGSFTPSKLIDFWAALSHLSFCIAVWQRKWNVPAAPVMSQPAIKRLLASGSGLDDGSLGELLDQFSLDPHVVNQDPFYRPIVKVDEAHSLVASTFIETGRFARNLFTIAIAEGNVDMSAKGLKPLIRIQQLFRRAGFDVRLNISLRNDERCLTDVDLAAHKDGRLFLAQAKVLIDPDTLYEEWKARAALEHAAQQLQTCLDHGEQLWRVIGITGSPVSMVPFILTNIWDFTGMAMSKFKILDFSYLENLLTGANVDVRHRNPQEPRRRFSFIRGRFPTAPELERLILKPLHSQMFEHPKIERKEFSVGGWRMSIPVWARDRKPADSSATNRNSTPTHDLSLLPPAS